MPMTPEQRRLWYDKNRDKIRARWREWYARNRERVLRARRLLDRNKMRANGRRCYAKHRDEILQRQKQKWSNCSTRLRNVRIRKEMISAYGGACSCCRERIPEFLTLDHILGGGDAHRRSSGGGNKMLMELRLKGWPKDDYRLLCMNCNWATRYKQPCPHEAEQADAIRMAEM